MTVSPAARQARTVSCMSDLVVMTCTLPPPPLPASHTAAPQHRQARRFVTPGAKFLSTVATESHIRNVEYLMVQERISLMTKFGMIFTATSIAAVTLGTAVWASSHGQGQGQGGGAMAGFVTEWDMNEDGVVTIEDLADRRGMLFDMFDLNGDGGIDGEEQANMAETIAGQMEANHGGEGRGNGQGGGHGRGGPGQMIHAAMTADFADTDRDGIISAAEWAEATPRLFTQMDANEDGQLNQMDFRRGNR
jgi:hypothetical protein